MARPRTLWGTSAVGEAEPLREALIELRAAYLATDGDRFLRAAADVARLLEWETSDLYGVLSGDEGRDSTDAAILEAERDELEGRVDEFEGEVTRPENELYSLRAGGA